METETPIEFTCTCGERLEVPPHLIGKTIECGACCEELTVPFESETNDPIV